MKATITSITLKNPFKFFALSAMAINITKQLKKSNYKAFRKKGFWITHYTMTLWANENDLKHFANSGAHLKAMQKSAAIAREIRTITIDTNTLPRWQEAKQLLQNGKVHKF